MALFKFPRNLLAGEPIKDMLPLQPGDVPDTFADSSELKKLLDISRLRV